MRLSMKKRSKTSRKSRMLIKLVKPLSPKIGTTKTISTTESSEEIKNFYINSTINKVALKDPIMCVFKSGKKEISFEAEGSYKIIVKIHNSKAGGYPITNSFTFRQLEKMLSSYIKKKAGN